MSSDTSSRVSVAEHLRLYRLGMGISVCGFGRWFNERRLTINWMRYLLLAAGMAIFGSATPVSKLITEVFPPLLASGIRVLLVAVVLSPVLIHERHVIRSMQRRDWAVVFGIALIGVMLFSVLMLLGMNLVTGVAGSIVMSTTPAITAIGSFLFLKDRLGWRKALGIALSVAGVVLVNVQSSQFGGGGGNLIVGSLLVLGAVCCEAAYTILGKVGTRDLSPLLLAALSASIATLLFLPFALFQGVSFDWAAVSLTNWIEITWWSIGIMGLGTFLWYTGVQQVPGSVAAGFMGIMPISALVLSYVLLGERFRMVHLLGFGIVFAGVAVISWSHARMSDS